MIELLPVLTVAVTVLILQAEELQAETPVGSCGQLPRAEAMPRLLAVVPTPAHS